MKLIEVKKAFLDKIPEDQRAAFLAEFHAAERGDARHKVVNKYGIHLTPEERKGVEEFFAEGNQIMDMMCAKAVESFLAEFVEAAPGDARHKVVNKFGIHLNPEERKAAEDFFAKADLGVIVD